MAHHSDFQQQVIVLLAKLKAKKEALQKEYEARSAEIDREIESVSTTLRLLREPEAHMPNHGTIPKYVPATFINELMGKTIREALHSIARANNGIVRIKEVKPALIEAGVIKRHKHAWGAIFTTLTRSPEFEKVPNQAGTFRLIENPAQSKLSVAS
jgi:hypothetical protein